MELIAADRSGGRRIYRSWVQVQVEGLAAGARAGESGVKRGCGAETTGRGARQASGGDGSGRPAGCHHPVACAPAAGTVAVKVSSSSLITLLM